MTDRRADSPSVSKLWVRERAPELKAAYAVRGYYTERPTAFGTFPVRPRLDMIRHDEIPLMAPAAEWPNHPDVYAVMMNPGSSEPLEAFPTGGGWVLAKPDPTQYQIMKLGLRFGWRQIRVLNLSDIRDANSGRFQKLLADLDADGIGGHSIFSRHRADELAGELALNPEAPVLLAWGRDGALKHLAEAALAALQHRKIVGIAHTGGWAYSHARPMLVRHQQEWLVAMEKQLEIHRG